MLSNVNVLSILKKYVTHIPKYKNMTNENATNIIQPVKAITMGVGFSNNS